MKLLWLFCVLPLVYGKFGFESFYSRHSRLCHTWSCVNTKLGLPESLTPRDLAKQTFSRVLPQGPWQDVLDKVLDNCYNNRSRRYTNTCPGQALLHCVVDEMINNCPDENWRKSDGCSPVSSLAGFKHMFSVSRYDNLENNLQNDHRPKWFLKNYFDKKCCDLPTIFNSSVLQECGFSTFITYYEHGLAYQHEPTRSPPPQPHPHQNSDDKVLIVSLNQTTTSRPLEPVTVDPLDCCDMTDFIQPSWRTECGFQLSWKGQDRLVIGNSTPVATEAAITTTTARTNLATDLMFLPHSCPEETCVFKKLGIVTDSGVIDDTAFRRMLDNFTEAHPSWKKPATRVLTRCLGRAGNDYDNGCEINNILACTLDVLTENCPYKRKSEDLCKRNKRKSRCQISSSKVRPKNRREICLLPPLVDLHHLSECGIDSLYQTKHIVVPEPKPKKHFWSSAHNLCQDQKPSTTCVMSKMGVLNKYQFMDYFRMKDRIRQFTSNEPVWTTLLDIYMSAYINIPMYAQHCSSQKKFLNVIDAMVSTCPVPKRKDTPQCKQLYQIMTETPLTEKNFTRQKLDEMMKHYHHIFPHSSASKIDPVIRKPKIVKKTIYNYGLLDSDQSPKVTVIDIKPAVVTRLDKPLVLAPVYLRHSKPVSPMQQTNLYGRSRPYWLRHRLPKGPFTTPAVEISTKIESATL